MSLIINNKFLRSNRKTVAITKFMLYFSIALVLIIVGVNFITLTFLSIVISFFGLLIIILSIFMIITLKNYEVSECGICIGEINVPWNDILLLMMPFQSRRILLLIYKKRNKKKYVILIANTIKDKSLFFPETLRYDFQSELEKHIRLKIKQDKGSGLFT